MLARFLRDRFLNEEPEKDSLSIEPFLRVFRRDLPSLPQYWGIALSQGLTSSDRSWAGEETDGANSDPFYLFCEIVDFLLGDGCSDRQCFAWVRSCFPGDLCTFYELLHLVATCESEAELDTRLKTGGPLLGSGTTRVRASVSGGFATDAKSQKAWSEVDGIVSSKKLAPNVPWCALFKPFLRRIFLGPPATQGEILRKLGQPDGQQQTWTSGLQSGPAAPNTSPNTFYGSLFRFESNLASDGELFPLRLLLLSQTVELPILLHSTNVDGTSFSKLAGKLHHHGEQPTLLLLRTKTTSSDEDRDGRRRTPKTLLLGGFAPGGFDDRGGRYLDDGRGEGSFLFGIQASTSGGRANSTPVSAPVYHLRVRSLLPGSSSVRNYTYLNSKNPYNPVGIGFGGQGGQLSRLLVDTNFGGHVLFTDRMFEQGHVFSESVVSQDEDVTGKSSEDEEHRNPNDSPEDPPNNVLPPPYQWEFPSACDVEVIALGGLKAIEKYERAIESDAKFREAHRKVDRSRFADSAFDREHLLGNTFNLGADAARAAVEEHRREKE